MYSASALVLATSLLASVGLAAPTPKRDGLTFDLIVNSTDGSGRYNEVAVGACHSGAAIEALCVYPGASSPFSFNATSESPVLPSDTNPGYLVYTLDSEPTADSQALNFYQNATSNVAAGFFGTGNGPQLVAFTENGELSHVVASNEEQFTWYVCPQSLLGYQYETVSFVPVGETPDNTDCAPVSVFRSF